MTYKYDLDLPYVVECHGKMDARFRTYEAAEVFIAAEYPATHTPEIIDTTPKPRVPADATWITWHSYRHGERYVAFKGGLEPDTWRIAEVYEGPFEDLPGVTPDTFFTVLDERKS